jgi:hypothetical protein
MRSVSTGEARTWGWPTGPPMLIPARHSREDKGGHPEAMSSGLDRQGLALSHG